MVRGSGRQDNDCIRQERMMTQLKQLESVISAFDPTIATQWRKDFTLPDNETLKEAGGPYGLVLDTSPQAIECLNNTLAGGLSKAEAEREKADKFKATNFQASLLQIGKWVVTPVNGGDLVAKCYYAKQRFVWEILKGGLKYKIELHWNEIIGIHTQFPENGPCNLILELRQPPYFFHERNPQPKKHTLWEPTQDFTDGEALTCRFHNLKFPEGVLQKQYEKLLQCDNRLRILSQQPFPTYRADTLGFPPQPPVSPDTSLQGTPMYGKACNLNGTRVFVVTCPDGIVRLYRPSIAQLQDNFPIPAAPVAQYAHPLYGHFPDIKLSGINGLIDPINNYQLLQVQGIENHLLHNHGGVVYEKRMPDASSDMLQQHMQSQLMLNDQYISHIHSETTLPQQLVNENVAAEQSGNPGGHWQRDVIPKYTLPKKVVSPTDMIDSMQQRQWLQHQQLQWGEETNMNEFLVDEPVDGMD